MPLAHQCSFVSTQTPTTFKPYFFRIDADVPSSSKDSLVKRSSGNEEEDGERSEILVDLMNGILTTANSCTEGFVGWENNDPVGGENNCGYPLNLSFGL